MGALDTLQDGVSTGIGEIREFVVEHPVGVALGAVSTIALGAGIVALASSGPKKKTKRKVRKKHKKITHTKRGWRADQKRRSKQKWELAYQKRKRKLKKTKPTRRSGKVRYTKKGQPYIILKSGKARFIKKTKRRKS